MSTPEAGTTQQLTDADVRRIAEEVLDVRFAATGDTPRSVRAMDSQSFHDYISSPTACNALVAAIRRAHKLGMTRS